MLPTFDILICSTPAFKQSLTTTHTIIQKATAMNMDTNLFTIIDVTYNDW